MISSGPSLVSRASHSYFSMWIEVKLVVLHETLGQDDRVLVVAALPGHEGDEDVLAERELAVVGRVGVGEDLTLLDRSPTFTIGRWLKQVPWLVRMNFCSL